MKILAILPLLFIASHSSSETVYLNCTASYAEEDVSDKEIKRRDYGGVSISINKKNGSMEIKHNSPIMAFSFKNEHCKIEDQSYSCYDGDDNSDYRITSGLKINRVTLSYRAMNKWYVNNELDEIARIKGVCELSSPKI